MSSTNSLKLSKITMSKSKKAKLISTDTNTQNQRGRVFEDLPNNGKRVRICDPRGRHLSTETERL